MATGIAGEWDGVIKARKAFFAAERGVVKASRNTRRRGWSTNGRAARSA